MYKSKLNHDQRLIMKLNDLPIPSRKSYISRLSSQAISNVVAYVASSTKWNYKSSVDVDMWTNDHLNCTVEYDHNSDTFRFHSVSLEGIFKSYENVSFNPTEVFDAEDLESIGFNTIGAWSK
jgi:hypothetical protein